MIQEKTRQKFDSQSDSDMGSRIVLFNDDVNTFEHVIASLVEICGHDELQAEQCALVTHYNGKCVVKGGDYSELTPIANTLLERGLSVELN